MTSPLSFLVIECYGGAAGQIVATLPRTRIGTFLGTLYLARSGLIRWRLRFTVSGLGAVKIGLRPFSASAHLASALDIEAEEVIDTAFGTNLPRLRAVKEKYDPTNFFRVNYNIKPLSSQAGAA